MYWTIAGTVLLSVAIASGFIECTEAEWQTYRIIFPVFAGLGIGGGIVMIAMGAIQNYPKH